MAVRRGLSDQCRDLQEAMLKGERLSAEDRTRLMAMIRGELEKAGLR
jgi:hypothetical protein